MRAAFHSRGPAAKLAAGLALTLVLSAAAAYAAVRPGAGHGGERRLPGRSTVPVTVPVAPRDSAALRIAGHPPSITLQTTARFQLLAAGQVTLRCRLDRQPAAACGAGVVYRGLRPGTHSFFVAARRPGRAAVHADFGWRVLEPKPFTVAPRPAAVGPLYPGATPSAIPVVLSNPNPVAITVTSLRVTASGGGAGCAPSANLVLTAPALARDRLRIPAEGSVSLPSATVAAPTIGLLDLSADQDPCQSADFDLAFSGSAGA